MTRITVLYMKTAMCTFMEQSCWIILTTRHVLGKVVEKNRIHILPSMSFFSENLVVCEIIRETVPEHGRSEVTIWCGKNYAICKSSVLDRINKTKLRTQTHNITPLNTKRRPFYLKTQSIPRCKHFSSRL